MSEFIKGIVDLSDAKAIIATIVMVAMLATAVSIGFILVKSFKQRKEYMAVKLPELNASNKSQLEKPAFDPTAAISIEMVNSEEEEKHIDKNSKNVNQTAFIEALSIESRKVIIDETEDIKVNMPEVQEMDYEAEAEAIRLKKEAEKAEHLRKLAEADNENDHILDNIEKL